MFKNTPLLLIAFLFFFSASYAQDKTTDSLKIAFQNPKMHDTTKMATILNVMKSRYTMNSPTYYYLNNWNGKLAQEVLKRNNTPAVHKKATLSLSTYYNGMAIECFVKGRIDQSIPYLDKSIALCKSVKSYEEMYYQYINKAKILYRINETEKAASCLFTALGYYEKNPKKYPDEIAYANSTLANIYAVQKKHNKAIEYFKKVLKHYEQEATQGETMYLLAVNYANLASSYQQLHQYDDAVNYYNKSLELSKKNGDNVSERLTYASLGMVKLDQDKYDEAEKIFLDLLRTRSTPRAEAHNNLALARLYLEKKEFAKARDYAEKGVALAVENNYLELQEPASDFLYQISKGNGDFKRALEMRELNLKLNDSTKMEASKNALEQQQLKYDFEKREMQQQILQQKRLAGMKLASEKIKQDAEKKTALQQTKSRLAQQQLKYDFERKALNQKLLEGKKLSGIKLDAQKKNAAKNNWLIGLSGILLLLLLAVYFYYRNNKQRQAISLLEKEQIKQKLLVTQMNPHFIFNSIENIQGLIYEKKDEEAVNYLDKFSALTRQILENSNENYISLTEEVQMIQNYMAIQQLLYHNKFSYTITLEDKIEPETIFLPPMLTQPFIENAIKHGLGNTEQNGIIAITFYLNENKLFFEVSDNGKGFDTVKKASNHKSLAMTITKERLIGYTKNKDFVVHTDNITDQNTNVIGAKVRFEIPYIYEN